MGNFISELLSVTPGFAWLVIIGIIAFCLGIGILGKIKAVSNTFKGIFDTLPAVILLFLIGLIILLVSIFRPANNLGNVALMLAGAIMTIGYGVKLVYLAFLDGKVGNKDVALASDRNIKKFAGADINKLWSTNLLIGTILSLLFLTSAFDWKPKVENTANLGEIVMPDDIEIEPPPTEQKPPPPPPPPPPPVLEIVEDEEVIEEEPIIEETIVEEEEAVEIPEEVIEEIEEIIEEEEEIEEIVEEEPEIFTIVEQMPSFPGGDEAMMKYIYGNIKYPAMARENDISGLCVVSFVVMEDGSIESIEVKRDIGGGCGDEAKRVVLSMPKWEPGKQRGKAVRVAYNLPVRFKLE